jgi:hypothetical protein
MSLNTQREILSNILNLSKQTYTYYVFLEDEKNIKRQVLDSLSDLDNCVASKSYGSKKYLNVYVNAGDWNPSKHTFENIFPEDVDYVCRTKKNLKDDLMRKRFTEGYMKLKIIFYRMIIDAYILDTVTYQSYVNRLVVPNIVLERFISKFEFFVVLNSNLLYFFSKIINKDNYIDIMFFKTGFPRFSYFDTDILLSTKNIKIDREEKIMKFYNKLQDNDSFLNYINVCLDNSSFKIKNTYVVVQFANRNIFLYNILQREYEANEYDLVRNVIQKYFSFIEGKETFINVGLGDFFSEKEINAFNFNKKKFIL